MERCPVGDVAAGAAAHEEAAGEIGVGAEPGVGGGGVHGLCAEPEEGVIGVMVSGGETLLGGKAIFDGEDKGRERGGEAGAGDVEGGRGGAKEDEATSMEVEDDGEGVGGWGRGSREEETDPSVMDGVETDIFGEGGEGGV